MDIVEKIGEYKKKQGIPVVDLAREEKIINKMRKMAKDKNLSEAMVEDLFRRIILQARKNEGEEENEDKS